MHQTRDAEARRAPLPGEERLSVCSARNLAENLASRAHPSEEER